MEIKNVAVIGGGLMGRQIALNTAIYPYEVYLVDNNPTVLEAVRQWEEEYLAGRIAKGRMTEEQVAGIKSRFHVVESMEEAMKNADLVIEAVVEREDVKHAVLAEAARLAPKGAIIGTNSSRMVSSRFKQDVPDASKLLNVHYFNPALVMKLVEVVRNDETSDETVEAVMEFSRNTGKTPIIVQKEIDGFVVNRILSAIYAESRWLVEEGYCSYEDLDTACENGLGHPMGPFRLNDLTGIDLTYDIMTANYQKSGKKPVGYDQIKEMYDKGWYGKKSGRGFYDYTKK
jgi:3-hydroxybutyryl-CoA dehydrogenase